MVGQGSQAEAEAFFGRKYMHFPVIANTLSESSRERNIVRGEKSGHKFAHYNSRAIGR